jgi:hypothetical protein
MKIRLKVFLKAILNGNPSYDPDLTTLYKEFLALGVSTRIMSDHRHASDYNRVGVLFFDLWGSSYKFEKAPRINEASRMLKHLKYNLLNGLHFKRYDPVEDMERIVIESAKSLIEVLYCSVEDLPRYVRDEDKDRRVVASWRLEN